MAYSQQPLDSQDMCPVGFKNVYFFLIESMMWREWGAFSDSHVRRGDVTERQRHLSSLRAPSACSSAADILTHSHNTDL